MIEFAPSPQTTVAKHGEFVALNVAAWSAWAPGLDDADAWRRWATDPFSPTGPQRPELAHFPPMLRRRAERLARMALQTTHDVRGEAPCPVIFASRHGELVRATALLTELAAEQRVSPGPFSLSVHNAVAALHSIANADTGYFSAVAGGRETVEAALVEAAALLHEGHRQVIVSVYEECVPTLFARYADEPDAAFAWSWRLTRAGEGTRLRLGWSADTSPTSVPMPALPHALEVLRFFLGNDARLEAEGNNHRWTYARG